MIDLDDPVLFERLVKALDNAHRTQPCPCGSKTWASCWHAAGEFGSASDSGIIPNHSVRRAKAVIVALKEFDE